MKGLIDTVEEQHNTDQIKKTAYRLKNRGYLYGSAYTGYHLSQKGSSKLTDLNFRALEQTQDWDYIWRLVIYDIPEVNRADRNSVRRLIKQLGFKLLQQSVWAHPLPCLAQFEQIRKNANLDKELLLLEVPHSEIFSPLLKEFQQLYPKL